MLMLRIFLFFVAIALIVTGFSMLKSPEAQAKKTGAGERLVAYCQTHPEKCDMAVNMLCTILDAVEYDSQYCQGDEMPQECPTPDPQECPSPEPEPEPQPEPTPSPSIDHLLISEVYYDVDSTHGTESSNEWVEIYNGTGSSVDLSGWKLVDNKAEDMIPDGSVLTDGSYAIVVRDNTTAPFWSIPSGTIIIELGSQIGNGLGNSGDALYLKDTANIEIDSLSWGTNTDVFNPAAPDVLEGHSLARSSISADTGTASDWIDLENPTPGS